MTNDFLTTVILKNGEMTVTMDCDMSLTEDAVDFMFRLLVLSGHHASNVSKSMVERGEEYLNLNK
jgi:hypothetical protein